MAAAAAPDGVPTVEATVKVFELEAHERANIESPIVSTLTEGTKLRVESQRHHGWRKARLVDGSTAFVEEKGLTLPPPASDDPDDDDSTSNSDRTYVLGLDQLSELVRSDATVRPLAERLQVMDSAGTGIMVGSALVGVGLMILSISALSSHDCAASLCGTNKLALFGGGGLAILGPLIGRAIVPGRDDVQSVARKWNARHPDGELDASLYGASAGTGTTVIRTAPRPASPH